MHLRSMRDANFDKKLLALVTREREAPSVKGFTC